MPDYARVGGHIRANVYERVGAVPQQALAVKVLVAVGVAQADSEILKSLNNLTRHSGLGLVDQLEGALAHCRLSD